MKSPDLRAIRERAKTTKSLLLVSATPQHIEALLDTLTDWTYRDIPALLAHIATQKKVMDTLAEALEPFDTAKNIKEDWVTTCTPAEMAVRAARKEYEGFE